MPIGTSGRIEPHYHRASAPISIEIGIALNDASLIGINAWKARDLISTGGTCTPYGLRVLRDELQRLARGGGKHTDDAYRVIVHVELLLARLDDEAGR